MGLLDDLPFFSSVSDSKLLLSVSVMSVVSEVSIVISIIVFSISSISGII